MATKKKKKSYIDQVLDGEYSYSLMGNNKSSSNKTTTNKTTSSNKKTTGSKSYTEQVLSGEYDYTLLNKAQKQKEQRELTKQSQVSSFTNNALTRTSQKISSFLLGKDDEEDIAPVKPTVTTPSYTTNEDGYTLIGKSYGDYFYEDYVNMKDYPIVQKDGNFYILNPNAKKPEEKYLAFAPRGSTMPVMTTQEIKDKEYEEAVRNGYVNRNQTHGLSSYDLVKLDSANLTPNERKEYTKDLKKQQKEEDEEADRNNKIRRGGAGWEGAKGELEYYWNNLTGNIDEKVVDPIKNAPESYKMGKMSEELGMEAYKSMMGEENNYEELKKEYDNYVMFNEDIATDDSMISQSIQSMPNQWGGFKAGVKGGGVGSVIGGTVGAILGKTTGVGTVKGATTGAKWLGGAGYTAGQMEYTYKLEAGMMYQTLIEMGVPEDIAKEEAQNVGLINAGIEGGESILDLITLGKASAVTKGAKDYLVKKYGLEMVENWAIKSAVINPLSEGLEEGLQEKSSIEGEKRATKKAGIERDDSQDAERIWDSAKVGAFSGLMFGGATAITTKGVNAGVNKVTSNKTTYTQNEQAVIDKEVENRVAEAEKNGKELTTKEKNEIKTEVIEDLENGYISTDSIENTLGGDTYTSLSEIRENKSKIEQEIDELENKPYAQLTVKENDRLKALREELSTIDTNTLETQLQSEMNGKIANDNRLQRSYVEKYNRSQKFTRNESEKSDNANINDFYTSMEEANVNNTKKTHDFTSFVSNIIKDKGIKARAVNYDILVKEGRIYKDTDEQYKFIENGKKTDRVANINGFKENGVLNINMQSSKAFEMTVGHELGEFIKDSDSTAYQQLKDIAIELGKADGSYNEGTLESYIKAYGELTDDATDEYVNDKLGELFDNDQFVTRISENRSLLRKIIDELKYLVEYATAGSSEKRKLVSLQHKLENKFREVYKKTDLTKESSKDTRFSANVHKSMTQKKMDSLDGIRLTTKDGYEYVIPSFLYQGKSTAPVKNDSVSLAKFGDGEYYTPSKKRASGYGEVTEYSDINDKFQNPYIQGTPYNSKMIELLNEFKENNPSRKVYIDRVINQGFPLTQEFMTPREMTNLYLEAGYDSFIGGTDAMPEYLSFTPTTEKVSYSLSTDNQGRELTKEQQDFFKDSKARDENGNLQVVYHGTTEEINVFEKDRLGSNTGAASAGQGFFFTASKQVADAYAMYARPTYIKELEAKQEELKKIAEKERTKEAWNKYYRAYEEYEEAELDYGYGGRVDYENTKETYLNITNPLIHDFKGEEYRDESYYDLLKQAKENGNDGAIFLNTYDGYGEHDSWNNPKTNIYVVFESNQIKNVDNTKPTSNPDIRYSLNVEGLNEIANEFGGGKNYWEANLYDKDLYGATYFLKHQDSVKKKFKDLNNINIEPIYRDIELKGIGTKDENVQNFIKTNNLNVVDLANNQELLDKFYELEHEAIKKQFNIDDTEADEIFSQWKDYFERQKGNNDTIWPLLRFEKDFKNIIEGNTKEIDNIETAKLERQLVDDNPEFEKYVTKYAEKLFGEKVEYDVDDVMEEAKFNHGTTDNFEVGAYMTTDGSLLNFNYGGYRDDHRTISVYDLNMKEFMDYGAIRMQPETPGFEMQVEPTNDQYNKLYDYIDYIKSTRKSDDVICIDVDKGNTYDSARYTINTPTSKIISDVKTYWKTGQFPKQSEFAQFRYSLTRNDEIAPTTNPNLTYAEDVKLEVEEAIAPLKQEIAELKETLAPLRDEINPKALTEEDLTGFYEARDNAPILDAPPEVETVYDNLQDSISIDKKSLKELTKNIQNELGLKRPQVAELEGIIQDFSRNEVGTREDLFETIKEHFSEQSIQHRNEDVIKVKNFLRTYPIKVSDYLKTEFKEGFNKIRQQNFNKLKFTNDGIEVDTAYDELRTMFKGQFRDDITNAQDQLNEIIRVANQDVIEVENFVLDNATVRHVSNHIYDSIQDYRLDELKKMVDKQTKTPIDESLMPPIDEELAPITKEVKPTQNTIAETKPVKKQVENEVLKIKGISKEQQATNKEIAEILDTEPTNESDRNKRKWAIFKASVFDKGAVIEDLSLKNKNRELMGKWDFTLTSEARGQNIIGNGHFRFDPATKQKIQTSKSLNDIVQEVGNTGLTKQFYEYMYHKHNIDRMTLEERFGTENKAVIGDSVTAQESRKVVSRYETQHPEFMDFAQDVYDYLNADKQELVDNGVISQESSDLWSEMYPHYVPIRRVTDKGLDINVPLDTGRTGINAPIKQATGGNADILPLFDTMAMRTLQTQRATAKNSFGIELKNTLGTDTIITTPTVDEVIDSIDAQEELLQEGKKGAKPTFTVFENGEKVTFTITKDMYDAMKPLSDSSILSKTIKPLNMAGNFHRGILTEYNPVFMLTNAIKDTQDVFLNSQHSARTYANIPEAYAQILSKGYWYQEYVANGGEQNSYFDSQENTFKPEAKGFKKVVTTPFRAISKINNLIEMSPRLAEYMASRKQGKSVEVSMLDASRVTTNFKAGGDLTKFLNRNGATFLNASVQGGLQQIRNIREANANGFKGWVKLASKFALAGVPALILNNLVWEDDEEYEELSDYVKQNYYIVGKYGDGKFIRIPKGRTVAVIQNGFEQMEHLATGDDEADFKTFFDLFITNLAPNNPIEDNVFAPIIQVANNKTWYGEDLVPTRLQDNPVEQQYDESTDILSRWIGETFGVSPYKVNYLLDQYTGGAGDVFLPMLTPEAESGDDSFEDKLFAPLKSKFTADSVMNNQNVSDFYEKSEELTIQANKTNATDEDILRNKYMNSVKAEMNELYAEKREIQNSNLPDSEKYRQVREKQKEINNLSKNALSEYDNARIYDNYAQVGDRHYRINGNGDWTKINDKQLAKQERMTTALNINGSDYWRYNDEIYDIKADKDSKGESISGSRKKKVISYVNSLDLSIPQKAILIRQEYPSFDEYNYDIINYVNNLDIAYEEKVTILEELEMQVDSNGNIRW